MVPPFPIATIVTVYLFNPNFEKVYLTFPSGLNVSCPSKTNLYVIALSAEPEKLTSPEPSPFGLSVSTPTILADI